MPQHVEAASGKSPGGTKPEVWGGILPQKEKNQIQELPDLVIIILQTRSGNVHIASPLWHSDGCRRAPAGLVLTS